MQQSAEAGWNQCLDLIRDNISRQSFKTWFEPLKPTELEEEAGQERLTVQLPSRFYYEWLEEHYFALLRKTITQVLGPQGRLFYHVVVEDEDYEHEYRDGRQPAVLRTPPPREKPQVPSAGPVDPPLALEAEGE